jgi:hypothetical protein
MKIKFLHTPKPRPYNYTPVFYNPEEEEKAQRKRELGIADSNGKDDFRTRLRAGWRGRSIDPVQRKAKPLTIAMYIVLAIIIIYLIFGG